jgi:hypothetical protein
MLEQMMLVTDKPVNAHAYCEARFPKLMARPPAIAISTLKASYPASAITFPIKE